MSTLPSHEIISSKSCYNGAMEAGAVLELYSYLSAHGVQIWIDGGWCVDALLGRQTREHPDLDIALDRKDAARFLDLMVASGYAKRQSDDDTDWNYVLEDGSSHQVDVHVFEYGASGENTYGIEYPYGALTGQGKINGQVVNCVAPEWMFKFKTAYAPKEKDLKDVRALSEKFGFKVPATWGLSPSPPDDTSRTSLS